MPRRKARSRPKKNSGPGTRLTTIVDWAGGVLTAGQSKTYALSDIAMISGRDRAFRVASMTVSVVSLRTSAAWQAEIFSPTSSVRGVAFSGPQLVGCNVRRLRVVNPDPSMYPATVVATTSLVNITSICQYKNDPGALRYILELHIQVGPEEFTSACPAQLNCLADNSILIDIPEQNDDDNSCSSFAALP